MAPVSEFRALGPVELWTDGQRQDLGSARARCILAILLLTPRTVVPAEALIDRVWDDNPPSKARENLSVYVARLRSSLRQAAGDEVRLVGRAGGYTLDVDPEAVDVHQFRRLRRQADALAASGDHDLAATALHEADGLWRGQALAGVSGDWVARMRDGLEEERRAAILERVGYELELGRHADLVGELGHLLAQYPLDETLVGHQMTALYWSGRQADALALYRETRDRLVSEQGAEPGPALAELHQRILGRDAGLMPSPAQRPGRAAPPDTLPPGPAEFVGRDAELAQLAGEHQGGPRITVIEGMPGVGKTALAVRAARLACDQYPDGALYVDLHPGEPLDPAEALHRLLRMLGLPASQVPDTIGDRVAVWRAQLARRRVAVVLDNAERLDQVRQLLPASGDCLVLITSRRRLGDIGGGAALTLDVLDPDDAAGLFARIAGKDRASDADQVAEVVRLCGWLPLAIQLTASRVARDPGLSLASLVEELSQSAAQLGGTGPASPEVMAAFDVSYQALEPDHQRMLRRLGASPCTEVSLHAAAALDDCTPAEAEKALGVLLDCHLLAQSPDGQFRSHNLIREYASVRAVRDDPEADRRQAIARLLDYFLGAADRADQLLHPFRRRALLTDRAEQLPAGLTLGTQEDAATWLASEWRSILLAAVFAGRHEWKQRCTDLSWLLAEWLEAGAYWDEAVTVHSAALQAARELTDPARIARAAVALGAVRQHIGIYDEARRLAEEAATTYRTLGDPGGEADAMDQLGMLLQRTAQAREALAYLGEARALYSEAADQRGVATVLGHTGISSQHLGRYQEAADYLRDSLSLYREIGDRRGEAKAYNNLGRIQLYQGRHEEALDSYQQSLDIFEEIGSPEQTRAILYHNIGAVHLYKGSLDEGLAACRRALAIYRSIGDLPNEGEVLNDIGAIYRSGALYDQALAHHQQAQAIAEQVGNPSQQLFALRGIADARRGSGQYEQALDDYDAALRLAREIGDPYEEGKSLEGIAESALSAQRPAAARITYRQALDIFERLGVPEADSARQRLETIDRTPGLRIS